MAAKRRPSPDRSYQALIHDHRPARAKGGA
jgi:hypothetical protein